MSTNVFIKSQRNYQSQISDIIRAAAGIKTNTLKWPTESWDLEKTLLAYSDSLEYEDVCDIINNIKKHFSDCVSAQYNTVVFSYNKKDWYHPDGQFKLDGEDRYQLSFDRSDAVLILRKG